MEFPTLNGGPDEQAPPEKRPRQASLPGTMIERTSQLAARGTLLATWKISYDASHWEPLPERRQNGLAIVTLFANLD